ncbi:unnamed protein product [Danaus chrysippus]|uniref:(African queen) hypothetical protein n=1 Tax=Danaus chrysippus TaxID=151541 RepID=A0A8J2QPW0_9NEOP|nr:unnamed protein product [Danaus chrysippus]
MEGRGLGVVASLGKGKCLPVDHAVDEDDYDRFQSASKLGIRLDFTPFFGKQLADWNLAPFLTGMFLKTMQSKHRYDRIGMTSEDEASILDPAPSTLRDGGLVQERNEHQPRGNISPGRCRARTACRNGLIGAISFRPRP